MTHTAAKQETNMAYEIDKAKVGDATLPAGERAKCAAQMAGNAMASGYHATVAAVTGENRDTEAAATKKEESATRHGLQEAEHRAKAQMNAMERKNPEATTGTKLTAGAKQATETVAAKYHESLKNA
eukprot:Mycagemm_TRINITY_DN10971_c0_g1::TRINITY_DN10971_c0_g1_i1::g.407::m.407 type:complete len:127 gc:universal TRINITY_DN10971_c0_g1_i1:38-418(+)